MKRRGRCPLVAIVDDDPRVGRALARLVLSLGFKPVIFGSGEELLAALAAASPDGVLLDLHLPGARGTEIVAALRRGQSWIKVVMMTGLDLPGSREACLAAGADAYVPKPIRREDLARHLAPLFERP